MTQITLRDKIIHTNGNLPEVGSKIYEFRLKRNDLSWFSSSELKGKKVILNIFPSIDKSTCATSVREFNKRAAELSNVTVYCISRDLPFAQKRFCGAEGMENVFTLSDYIDGAFGKLLGIHMTDGPLEALHARAVICLDESGTVIHSELVSELSSEPNYEATIKAIS
jgi:thiol peroxidase